MRGERRIKFPSACFGSTGKPLIHGLSSFSHHSLSLLSFPITPCCCVPPLPALSKHPYVFYQATFISSSLPVALSCPPFLTTIPSLTPPGLPLPYFLFFPPYCALPAPPPLALLNFPPPSFPCVTGLWGRWLPVHHQGDYHPHGELQLPCLRLWRPLSDTCAAGEWSVVAHFLLTVLEKSGQKCFLFSLCYSVVPQCGRFSYCLPSVWWGTVKEQSGRQLSQHAADWNVWKQQIPYLH